MVSSGSFVWARAFCAITLSGVKRKIRIAAAEPFADMAGDQPAVEASIFNEDFIRPRARNNHSSHVDSRNVRFQVLRIADGTKLFGGQLNAHAAQKS